MLKWLNLHTLATLAHKKTLAPLKLSMPVEPIPERLSEHVVPLGSIHMAPGIMD